MNLKYFCFYRIFSTAVICTLFCTT